VLKTIEFPREQLPHLLLIHLNRTS